jgi:uncharacterized tellurite resistance protein B-like protein
MPSRYPLIDLPIPARCRLLSTPAERVYTHEGGWAALLADADQALQHLHEAHGLPAVAWFCTLEGLGADGRPATRVGMAWTTQEGASGLDGHVFQATCNHAGLALTWTDEGEQALPDTAFPLLAWHGSDVHQVWIHDPEQTVALFLDWRPAHRDLATFGVTSPEELGELMGDVLDGLRVRFDDTDLPEDTAKPGTMVNAALAPDRLHLEKLKIAFAWQCAYMMVAADGKVVPEERAFMSRVFPETLLHAVELMEEGGRFVESFGAIKRQALEVLPTALSLEERIELLGLLHEAAMADGTIVPEEVEVFKTAAAMLKVPLEMIPWLHQQEGDQRWQPDNA